MESQFCTVEEALEELRAGHLIITIDDPDRENEGDLICAAQFATTENVNFMATHAKGPDLHPHERRDGGPAGAGADGEGEHRQPLHRLHRVHRPCGHHHRHLARRSGATPAASAWTRTRPEDLRRPGHVFPWWPGGAACWCATATPRPRWTCAAWRAVPVRPVLRDHAGRRHHDAHHGAAGEGREWGLKVITIKALQDYCRRHDKHVVREACAKMPTRTGTSRSTATSTTSPGSTMWPW